MLTVLGLGNPGSKYSNTRHNAGYDALCKIAAFFHLELKKRCFRRYMYAETDNIRLVFPLTYMNNSGNILKYLKISNPSDLVVMCDNMDLACGGLRVKHGGGASGQKGLNSITEALGSPDFVRVYIGIGRPKEGVSVIDYVLGREENPEYLEEYNKALELAAQAVIEYARGKSVQDVQCEFNRKGIL